MPTGKRVFLTEIGISFSIAVTSYSRRDFFLLGERKCLLTERTEMSNRFRRQLIFA
jgi:hypothetical protein